MIWLQKSYSLFLQASPGYKVIPQFGEFKSNANSSSSYKCNFVPHSPLVTQNKVKSLKTPFWHASIPLSLFSKLSHYHSSITQFKQLENLPWWTRLLNIFFQKLSCRNDCSSPFLCTDLGAKILTSEILSEKNACLFPTLRLIWE